MGKRKNQPLIDSDSGSNNDSVSDLDSVMYFAVFNPRWTVRVNTERICVVCMWCVWRPVKHSGTNANVFICHISWHWSHHWCGIDSDGLMWYLFFDYYQEFLSLAKKKKKPVGNGGDKAAKQSKRQLSASGSDSDWVCVHCSLSSA